MGRKGREAVLGLSLTTTAQTVSRVNMATCADILRSEFPEIDGQVFDYVTGERNRINCLGRPKWRSWGKTEGGQCSRPLFGLSSA